MYRYSTGEDVRVGDRVLTWDGARKGVIELVIEPGTEDAEAYQCPEGGVLVNEDWDGTPSLMLFIPAMGGDWEEVQFAGRGVPGESNP